MLPDIDLSSFRVFLGVVLEFFVLFMGSGGEADKLRCRMPVFVLSVNVQMKVMRNGIQAHFGEEVGWGGVWRDWGGDTRETAEVLNLVVLLKGQ